MFLCSYFNEKWENTRLFSDINVSPLCFPSLLALQIGALKNYYHFYHSRTIKRSVLSSRGTHSFISMEPKVRRTSRWHPRKQTAVFIGDSRPGADGQCDAPMSRTVLMSSGLVHLLLPLTEIGRSWSFTVLPQSLESCSSFRGRLLMESCDRVGNWADRWTEPDRRKNPFAKLCRKISSRNLQSDLSDHESS